MLGIDYLNNIKAKLTSQQSTDRFSAIRAKLQQTPTLDLPSMLPGHAPYKLDPSGMMLGTGAVKGITKAGQTALTESAVPFVKKVAHISNLDAMDAEEFLGSLLKKLKSKKLTGGEQDVVEDIIRKYVPKKIPIINK